MTQAKTPPMGYSNWNGFHNKINTSLFIETATFLKKSGLLAAGYDLVTLGGIGYANGSTWNSSEQGWPGGIPGNITRNATGFLQVDPVRFPGGNEGMRKLASDLRGMGFRWGSYTEAGTAGCNGAHGSSEGFEEQDAALFFGEWGSEYLMVDSCGIKSRSPPDGPPPGYNGGQARFEMTKWKQIIVAAQAAGSKPIVLHDCHNGCGSGYGGPTLSALPCNASDPAQLFAAATDGRPTTLIDGAHGLCIGCAGGPIGGCANDAETLPATNTSGHGLGMVSCQASSFDNGNPENPAPEHPEGAIRPISYCAHVDKNAVFFPHFQEKILTKPLINDDIMLKMPIFCRYGLLVTALVLLEGQWNAAAGRAGWRCRWALHAWTVPETGAWRWTAGSAGQFGRRWMR